MVVMVDINPAVSGQPAITIRQAAVTFPHRPLASSKLYCLVKVVDDD